MTLQLQLRVNNQPTAPEKIRPVAAAMMQKILQPSTSCSFVLHTLDSTTTAVHLPRGYLFIYPRLTGLNLLMIEQKMRSKFPVRIRTSRELLTTAAATTTVGPAAADQLNSMIVGGCNV